MAVCALLTDGHVVAWARLTCGAGNGVGVLVWLRRARGDSGALSTHIPIDAIQDVARRCLVEALESRQLLAASCFPEPMPSDDGSDLTLLAVKDREATPE